MCESPCGLPLLDDPGRPRERPGFYPPVLGLEFGQALVDATPLPPRDRHVPARERLAVERAPALIAEEIERWSGR
jgi:hypothetical protein